MDSILNKLTEIESAAAAIVQHAEAEKTALDDKYDAKRKAFDAELESKTQQRIQTIRDELQAKTDSILNSQNDESNAAIEALQKEYEGKHTDYAQEILRRITEV